MKQTKTRLSCLLLAVLMLVSITACGKNKTAADPNLLKIGDSTLLYKGAYITEDYDGNDALVLTLDYTNNGKSNASYLFNINESAMQNGIELEWATIFTDYDSYETLLDNQMKEVAPGATLEIGTAFVLPNTTDPVEVLFEQFIGTESSKLTIDLTTLSRNGGSSGSMVSTAMDDGEFSWWTGDWYGWWTAGDASGEYDYMQGAFYDCCASIELDKNGVGKVTIWDEVVSKSAPLAIAEVKIVIDEDGNTLLEQTGGEFLQTDLEEGTWLFWVDTENEHMMDIFGTYQTDEGSFGYLFVLRPWGMLWDDVVEDDMPYYYDSWYLPLIDEGVTTPPDVFEIPE